MHLSRRATPIVTAKYRKSVLCAQIFVALAMIGLVAGTPAEAAGPGPVGLATAGDFAVLGGSTVTNTGPTVLTGNLGLSPGKSITGFPPGTVNGSTHVADAVARQAQSDLTTAYDDAAGRTSDATISADLGGRTLTPGVYTSASSLGLTGTLTLDGQGDENAVFIFQAGSTLTTASGSRVALIGGAQACNVVWQVGSSATLGTDSVFTGNILALESITLTTGATVDGSMLARNGAVTLDTNTISTAVCSDASVTPTTIPDDGTTATTLPDGGTTATTLPDGGTTGTTLPDGGTTGTTVPDGGTTGTTVPDGGTTGTTRRMTGTTIPDGGTTTTNTVVPPPLARTGAGHREALSGLALTGLGLMLVLVTRRRAVSR